MICCGMDWSGSEKGPVVGYAQHRTFRFHTGQRIYWPARQLLISQEGLCSVELAGIKNYHWWEWSTSNVRPIMGSNTNHSDVLYPLSKYQKTAASNGPNRAAVTLLMTEAQPVFVNQNKTVENVQHTWWCNGLCIPSPTQFLMVLHSYQCGSHSIYLQNFFMVMNVKMLDLLNQTVTRKLS